MQKPFIAQIIFCIFIFSSCSEDNRDLISEKPLPVGEPIVGIPIIPEEARFKCHRTNCIKTDSKGEEPITARFPTNELLKKV